MKKIILNNNIYILTFLILFIWGLFGIYTINKEYKLNDEAYEINLDKCNIGEYKDNIKYKQYCSDLIENGKPYKPDTIFIFFDYIGHSDLYYLQLIAPLFVMISSIWLICKEMKSKYMKNILLRMNYKEYIIKKWFSSLKSVLIFPLFIFFLLYAAFLFSGHFNFQETITKCEGCTSAEVYQKFNIYIFFIVYIVNLVLHGIFWVNLSYVMLRNSKNFLITVISSFLIYLVIFIFLEVFVGRFILMYVFDIENGVYYVGESNIWRYILVDTLWPTILTSLVLAISSFALFVFSYRDKEKVLLKNEI